MYNRVKSFQAYLFIGVVLGALSLHVVPMSQIFATASTASASGASAASAAAAGNAASAAAAAGAAAAEGAEPEEVEESAAGAAGIAQTLQAQIERPTEEPAAPEDEELRAPQRALGPGQEPAAPGS